MNTYELIYNVEGQPNEYIKADYYAIRQHPNRVEFIITKPPKEPDLIVLMVNFDKVTTIKTLKTLTKE